MRKSQSVDVDDGPCRAHYNERRDSASIVEVKWFHKKLLNKIVQVSVSSSVIAETSLVGIGALLDFATGYPDIPSGSIFGPKFC